MLNRLESLTQNVGGNNDLVDQWLQARKQLLVAYYTLVGVKPNKGKHTPLNEKALENLCHNLLDYLSAGPFISTIKSFSRLKGRPAWRARRQRAFIQNYSTTLNK